MKKSPLIKAPWSRENAASYDRREIYLPLRDILTDVRRKLREFDLFVPIAKIAWMLIKGRFPEERHKPIKEDLYEYLRIGNDYRKRYFALKTDAANYFDRLMKRKGWYYPESKEYRYVRNEVYWALLREDKKQEWLDAFSTRMELLGRARSGGSPPPEGEEIITRMKKKFARRVNALIASRKKFTRETDLMLKYVEMAIKNPGLPWEKVKEKADGTGGDK